MRFLFTVTFSLARVTAMLNAKHRLHWLVGLIEGRASQVQSASACLGRMHRECPNSPHQANLSLHQPLNLALKRLCKDAFRWGIQKMLKRGRRGEGERGPQGKLSMKTDKNSAKQLIHSSVWLGEDLREHETLSGEELGLLCLCLCHFLQLLDVLSFPVWQQHTGHFAGNHNNHSFCLEHCI